MELTSPIILFGLQVPASRIFKRSPPQALLIYLIIVTQMIQMYVLFFVICAHLTHLFWSVLYYALTSFSISYIYFFIFSMGETARRIRILNEVRMAGALTSDEINSIYNEDEIIDSRLKR